jgi:hypothetical protein
MNDPWEGEMPPETQPVCQLCLCPDPVRAGVIRQFHLLVKRQRQTILACPDCLAAAVTEFLAQRPDEERQVWLSIHLLKHPRVIQTRVEMTPNGPEQVTESEVSGVRIYARGPVPNDAPALPDAPVVRKPRGRPPKNKNA